MRFKWKALLCALSRANHIYTLISRYSNPTLFLNVISLGKFAIFSCAMWAMPNAKCEIGSQITNVECGAVNAIFCFSADLVVYAWQRSQPVLLTGTSFMQKVYGIAETATRSGDQNKNEYIQAILIRALCRGDLQCLLAMRCKRLNCFTCKLGFSSDTNENVNKRWKSK